LFWDFVLKLTRCHAQGGFLRGLRRGSYYRARYYDPAAGRFLREDPLRFWGGQNFYPYTSNSPVTAIDPAGTNATVSVGPNGITINLAITIYGPGVSSQLASNWQNAIRDAWNNNPGYGGCRVNFNVAVTPDLSAKHWFTTASNPDFSPLAQNYVYVPVGMPTDPHINLSFFTGTIPSATLPLTVPHEAGHLMGLLDTNLGNGIVLGEPRDIMAEGDVITQVDINRIVNGSFPNTLKDIFTHPCGRK